LLKKTLQISFLSLLGSLFGFFSQVLTAKYFGATSGVDNFVVASSYPLFFTGLITISLNHYLVPEIIKRGNKETQSKFCSSIFVSFFAIFIMLSLAGYFLSPYQLKYFSPLANKEFINIARIYWLTAALMPMMSLFQSMHIAKNNVSYVSIAHLIPVLTTILFYTFFRDSLGLSILAYSLLTGNLINFLFLLQGNTQLIELSKIKFFDYFIISEFYKRIHLIGLSMLCYTIFQSSDVFWCKFLPESSLSYLSYMQRFLVAFAAINISTPIQLFLPMLSQHIKSGQSAGALKNIVKIFRFSLAIILFQCIFFYVFSENIIAVLFQRGLFDSIAVNNVSNLLTLSIFSSIFYAASIIMLRFLFANGDYKITAISGLYMAIFYFILSGILSQLFGLVGIPIAYTISWIAFCMRLFSKTFSGNLYLVISKNNIYFIKNILFSSIVFFISALLIRNFFLILQQYQIFNLVQLAAMFISLLVVYLIITIKIFPIKEVRIIFKKIRLNFFIIIPKFKRIFNL
jgi:putative peptidoglycan lipid II flippase